MRILVTGGAGFIGSHLCKRLLDDGHDVICLDNLLTGSFDNIAELSGNSHFTFIKHDVTEPFPELPVSRIFNLACTASPVHYQEDPVRTIMTSFYGAVNALNLAKNVKARVLQASTSEVYGNPSIHPQTEDYWGNVNPIGIRSCYDEGKRAAETLFFDYYRQYNVDIRVVRIFNTFGPKMQIDDGRVISNFIVQALKGENLTVYGDGLQTRSFCYVDDLVNGLVRFMEYEGTYPGPLNLGMPREMTMLSLADMILKLTESSASISFKPLPGDDPVRRKPDISQARKILNWEPVVDIESGLRKTIEFFKRKLS